MKQMIDVPNTKNGGIILQIWLYGLEVIRDLYKRHVAQSDMTMLKPSAVCLISQEVNCERAKLQQLAFGNDPHVQYHNRRKSFSTTLQGNCIQQTYERILSDVRKENFQGYQLRRDQIISEEGHDVNPTIIKHITEADSQFFGASLPQCQEFIDCFVVHDPTGYKPVKTVPRRATRRADFNESLTDCGYVLRKLNRLLDNQSDTQDIQTMIRDGILTKSDLKALVRLSKAAAKAENIQVSEEDQKRVKEVEALSDTTDEDYY